MTRSENFYSSSDIIGIIISRSVRWAEHVACMDNLNTYKV